MKTNTDKRPLYLNKSKAPHSRFSTVTRTVDANSREAAGHAVVARAAANARPLPVGAGAARARTIAAALLLGRLDDEERVVGVGPLRTHVVRARARPAARVVKVGPDDETVLQGSCQGRGRG